MGIFTKSIETLVVSIILSGILIGNINTSFTTAMMKIGDKDKSTTSATYNFICFIGSAIAPLFATYIRENIAPNVPFIKGDYLYL